VFYIITILSAFSLVLLLKDYKNVYSWAVALMVIGIDLSILSSVIYVSKLGNYLYINAFLHRLDYKIFLFFYKNLKISLSRIMTMLNGGITLYLFSIPLLAFKYRKDLNKKTMKKKGEVLQFILLILFAVFYYWFYHPATCYAVYIRVHTASGGMDTDSFISFILAIDHIISALTAVFLSYPIILLIKQYKEVKALPIRRNILVKVFSLFLLDVFFYYLFFIIAVQNKSY
jgi:hypothetical protein